MDVQHVVAQIGNSRCVERSCATCADISEETRLELARLVRIRTFRAGETGLAESEELPFVGMVVSGLPHMQRTLRRDDKRIKDMNITLASVTPPCRAH